MRDDLERFVASLAIPADRKAIVLAELSDHATSAAEAAARDGLDPEAAARHALGNLEALRRSLEAVESSFRITRVHAVARGLVAGVLVAIVIDRLGWPMMGALGALVALAITAALAPPHALALLRSELRAPRVGGTVLRGLPIGPALAYAFTVMAAPFAIWIGMIVVRARAGTLVLDVPWSAYSVMGAVCLVLAVEGVRARRGAEA